MRLTHLERINKMYGRTVYITPISRTCVPADGQGDHQQGGVDKKTRP